jgi:hypothetical protein
MTSNHILPSHPSLCSLSVASYDSQGLRWKYSNPSPHGVHRLRFNVGVPEHSREYYKRCNFSPRSEGRVQVVNATDKSPRKMCEHKKYAVK